MKTMGWLRLVVYLTACGLSLQQVIVPVKDPGSRNYTAAVKVFHYILDHWGQSFHGVLPCGDTYCEWVLADHLKHLRNNFLYSTPQQLYGQPLTTMAVYNIHTVWERTRDAKPSHCELPTNLSFAETEESWVRYSPLFDAAVKHFDGFSSTHPQRSSVQRIYKEAYLHEKELFVAGNFSDLVPGASYIASDCHRRDTANANRDSVVQEIRNHGLRVDGLGRCMHTPTGPEGISLPKTRDTRYNLHLKKQVIGKYMFHLAFENSIEDGYVTEKPFDALTAGTVPIYLGDPNTLKLLLPHPKAAICIKDYPSIAALVKYLTYLTTNATAYEEHRSWRTTFKYKAHVRERPLMRDSWYCRLCQWARNQTSGTQQHQQQLAAARPGSVQIHDQHYALPPGINCAPTAPTKKELLDASLDGKIMRFRSSKAIYIVRGGMLHVIPDMATFTALKLDVGSLQVIEEDEGGGKYIIGEPEPKQHG